MKKNFLSRVDHQVAALLSIMLVLFSLSVYFISTHVYYRSILKSLTNRVEIIHEYVEQDLTIETFSQINSKKDMDNDIYQRLKQQMEEVRDIGDLMYLYTAKRTDAGELVYVIDGLPEDASDFRYPGDLIEPEIQPELERALSGEVVLPERILDTDWGHIFIAYYPLHDCDGNVIGALGIEIAADVESAAFGELSKAISLVCILFCIIDILLAIFIFRRISNPLYRDMANTDFMTGLKNRNSYETDRQNITFQKRLSHLTVAVIDVNNLKLVNDELGHDAGDTCIVNAANVLRSMESDRITAYRYGGDEFIVLLEDISEPGVLLSEIKERFQKYADKLSIPTALAIGYAGFDADLDDDLIDTQRRADEFMYQDKLKIKQKKTAGNT